MNLFWDKGAMFVRELQGLYPEPQPHINTLSTMVRILESNGFLSHKAYGNTYQYYPVISREEYGRSSLSGIISNYLGNSYLNAVSELVREEKITVEELKALISEDMGEMDLGSTGRAILMKAIDGSSHKDFRCAITLGRPIIGIGAPSGVYMRWVGEALGSEVYISDDSDVGNAIGAVCSSVSESIKFVIRPLRPMREDAKYEVFSKLGNFKYENLQTALSESERIGREAVIASVESSGAEDISVSVDRDDHKYAIGAGESSVLMEIRLTVTAAGKPKQFTSSQ